MKTVTIPSIRDNTTKEKEVAIIKIQKVLDEFHKKTGFFISSLYITTLSDNHILKRVMVNNLEISGQVG